MQKGFHERLDFSSDAPHFVARMALRKQGLALFRKLVLSRNPLPVRLILAGLSLAIGLGLVRLCYDLLHGEELYPFIIVATIFASILGGLGPGIIASIAGAVIFDYRYAPPVERILIHAGDYLRLTLLVAIPILTSAFFGALKSALKAERRQSEGKSMILRFVSHDLKNPLSSILLNCELGEKFSEEPRIRRSLMAIKTAAFQLRHLIEDLVDTSKIEAGHFIVNAAQLDPEALLCEVAEQFGGQMKKKGIDFKIASAASGLEAFWDRAQIIRALNNLVGNALKFTPDGGKIEMRLDRLSPGLVRYSVVDNGPGISKRNLERIFEEFWQVEPGSQQGSGLGLFIVKGIVSAHGGQVSVQSVEGRGSVFSIDLPLKA